MHFVKKNSNCFYQNSNFYDHDHHNRAGVFSSILRIFMLCHGQDFQSIGLFSKVHPPYVAYPSLWYPKFLIPILLFFRLRVPWNEHAVPPRCRHPYCSVYYRSNFRHVGHRDVLRPVSKARCPHQNHTVLHQCSNMPKRWQTVT